MKKINSGINLFKLFSMFMIAQLHILGMGGIIGATAGTAGYYHAFFMQNAAFCAVNCYALASGYLMFGKKIRLSRIAGLWLEVFFYSVVISAIMMSVYRDLFCAQKTVHVRMLTFLPLEQIDEMSTWKDQRLNEAKEILAYELTSMVHGKEEAEKAQAAARALFGGAAMDTEHMPSTQLTEADLTDGSIGILTLMGKAGLAASNGEARRLVVQGGVLVDGEKVAAPTVSFTADQLKNGSVIKKGKKIYHKVTL